MVPVVWLCTVCDRPVRLEVETTKHPDGWHVHADQPIRVHMKQHQEA